MGGLSEKFARLQNEGRSNVEISVMIIKDIFFQDQPPPPPAELTKMKVFVAGLPRSGTGSLAVALTELGYNPCHGPGVFEIAPVLANHYAGQASEMDIIRWQEEQGFDVQGLDQLGWKLFKEAATIQDLKIILSEHPGGGKGWAESWSSFAPDHIHYFGQRPFSFMDSMVQVMRLNREFLAYIGGSDDPTDPIFSFPAPTLSASYERHNAAVRKIVPADRLLVFNPTQGWAPICRFLEIEEKKCPVTDYPHMTDRQLMLTISKVALALTKVWPSAPVAVIALVLSMSFFCRQKRKIKTV